jgi:exopolysaccharide biosynthesis WecB/TagA/CpsF family protein
MLTDRNDSEIPNAPARSMPDDASTFGELRAPTFINIGGFRTITDTAVTLAARMAFDCLAARASKAAGTSLPPKLVFSSNGQGISLASKDPAFSAAMAMADIVHADGMSVVFASRILSDRPLPERIATTDFFHDAAKVAQEAGLSFYILGGTQAELDDACAMVERTYPRLLLAGRHHGYFAESEEEGICADVRRSGADVLWVGLGKPAQEFFSVRNRRRLDGVGWVKTCGGLYAFLAGHAVRAPALLQRAGLEWAWRVAREPRRLAWRYAVTNPHAIYLMLRAKQIAPAKADE